MDNIEAGPRDTSMAALHQRSRNSVVTAVDDGKLQILDVNPAQDTSGYGGQRTSGTPERGHFTFRASIIGSLLGCFVAASNFYLGLKAGWTFGAQLFSAIFSFGILKTLSRVWGPFFGPEENCTAQTAASTTGGLSVGFITGIPALYRLGLMSEDVMDDLGKLIMWTIAAAFYGLFFAVPLRKHFVINHDFPFPTPRATAVTILTLHGSVGKQKEAIQTVKVMIATFAGAFAQTLLSYWIYFLDKIHVSMAFLALATERGTEHNSNLLLQLLFWIGRAAGNIGLQNADIVWGWHIVPNFAFYGAGLITPPATLLSFLAGSVIAFGIGGPVMLSDGYLSAALGWGKKGNGSAQSWWFWPGISLMLFSAFTELAVNYKTIISGTREALGKLVSVVSEKINSRRKPDNIHSEQQLMKGEQSDASGAYGKDPVPLAHQVPTLWWTGGLLVSSFWTCFTMAYFFKIPVYQSILSIIFAFFLALIGVQAAAETDINPISTLAKVVQLAFFKFPADSLQSLQRNNILSAAVTSAAANQAADMVGDLKTGHIVGASPRSQFLAQLIGSAVAIPVNLLLFIVFAKAYPCIVKPMDTCDFGLSPVLGWENFTKLLTTSANLPMASWVTALVCGFVAILFTIMKHQYIPQKHHDSLPNLGAIGLGFIVPQPSTPLAMCMAMVGGMIWKKLSPSSEHKFRMAVASGGIAGVGIAAVLRAVLKLSDVPDKVVDWNCPVSVDGVVKCL
ncbi:OPT superfamily oligopeptide transporter [Spizellomyces punctatus DAOM BR117]|uniref:OPT superfamily oligopeptide transporter n=1 Tax=Spizellomyces punctatus (strain DAOM BR117) TaxID=645134 RepID=A0A0L0H4B2_SPIPD|nr:OPT superfamily oligopeptide transporter [Spizellomyces punctatus DAOM BR117]KNC96037.1 OPT superfamily oligopeptide transporter [Spizellomyces punctatus DAOM BR117]|eukprot:XP_016604077.1 OPT superfamily oligopeptide transporter [Spizellomyces punctatus DAOM BR117]